MLAAAGVRYEDWLKLVLPILGLLAVLAGVGVVLAAAVRLS
jgi:uncharacterized ion transporter superfamily protein YfcC